MSREQISEFTGAWDTETFRKVVAYKVLSRAIKKAGGSISQPTFTFFVIDFDTEENPFLEFLASKWSVFKPGYTCAMSIGNESHWSFLEFHKEANDVVIFTIIDHFGIDTKYTEALLKVYFHSGVVSKLRIFNIAATNDRALVDQVAYAHTDRKNCARHCLKTANESGKRPIGPRLLTWAIKNSKLTDSDSISMIYVLYTDLPNVDRGANILKNMDLQATMDAHQLSGERVVSKGEELSLFELFEEREGEYGPDIINVSPEITSASANAYMFSYAHRMMTKMQNFFKKAAIWPQTLEVMQELASGQTFQEMLSDLSNSNIPNLKLGWAKKIKTILTQHGSFFDAGGFD